MKKIPATLLMLLSLHSICLAQKDSLSPAVKNVMVSLKKDFAVSTKSDSTTKRQCDSTGIFDTCCKTKKICCETKVIKPSNGKDFYILQKNFADAEPFAFGNFILKGRSQNLCIRICNINRIVYDITAKGEIVKTNLPDTGVFDALAKIYKDAGEVNVPATTAEKEDEPGDVGLQPEKAPKKQTPLEELKKDITGLKSDITKKAQSLAEDLKNLDRFARFAKNALVIIGSERYSQQKIKDRLGNQADIKAYKKDITYDSLSRVINADMPSIFESAKQNAEEINKQKEAIKKLIASYKEENCKPRRTSSGTGKNIRYYYSVPEGCDKLDELAELGNSVEINKVLDIATKASKDEL